MVMKEMFAEDGIRSWTTIGERKQFVRLPSYILMRMTAILKSSGKNCHIILDPGGAARFNMRATAWVFGPEEKLSESWLIFSKSKHRKVRLIPGLLGAPLAKALSPD